jgi:hypothetical protein
MTPATARRSFLFSSASWPGSLHALTSLTHLIAVLSADPRGIIPASIVNKALSAGKVQLNEMRRAMVELG